jgi:hypothetical protein
MNTRYNRYISCEYILRLFVVFWDIYLFIYYSVFFSVLFVYFDLFSVFV